jgi:hypothetical protein
MACELANAHAPYMQLGSVTVGMGAAAGVFERESLLLSENRSPMSTQVRDLLPVASPLAAPQRPSAHRAWRGRCWTCCRRDALLRNTAYA